MTTITEFVTDRQFDGYARRLFNQAMKTKHTSWSESAISGAASKHIVEIQSYKKGMLVRPGWREAMKAKAQEVSG